MISLLALRLYFYSEMPAKGVEGLLRSNKHADSQGPHRPPGIGLTVQGVRQETPLASKVASCLFSRGVCTQQSQQSSQLCRSHSLGVPSRQLKRGDSHQEVARVSTDEKPHAPEKPVSLGTMPQM